MTTVLIVDDQPLQRFGFRMLLESVPDTQVAGEASTGSEAVRKAAELRPDVVLMDVRMPGMDGIEATRQIVANGGRSRVLVLTTFDLDEYAHAALRAGASGFLLKDARPEELLAGIRAVAAGDAIIAPALTRRLLDAYVHHLPARTHEDPHDNPKLRTLTEREREILVARPRVDQRRDRPTTDSVGIHRQDARRPSTGEDRRPRPDPSRHPRLRPGTDPPQPNNNRLASDDGAEYGDGAVRHRCDEAFEGLPVVREAQAGPREPRQPVAEVVGQQRQVALNVLGVEGIHPLVQQRRVSGCDVRCRCHQRRLVHLRTLPAHPAHIFPDAVIARSA